MTQVDTQMTAAEQAEFDRETAIADEVMDNLFDDIPDDVDPVGVVYSLWVSLTWLLAEAGWTGDELARDAHSHVASATTEGSIN